MGSNMCARAACRPLVASRRNLYAVCASAVTAQEGPFPLFACARAQADGASADVCVCVRVLSNAQRREPDGESAGVRVKLLVPRALRYKNMSDAGAHTAHLHFSQLAQNVPAARPQRSLEAHLRAQGLTARHFLFYNRKHCA